VELVLVGILEMVETAARGTLEDRGDREVGAAVELRIQTPTQVIIKEKAEAEEELEF
jgi:hypothetical protein